MSSINDQQKESKKKRLYILWRDYLAEDEDYRAFCSHLERLLADKSTTDDNLYQQLEQIYAVPNASDNIEFGEFSDWWGYYQYWRLFGYVHKVTSEEWWDQNNDKLPDDGILDLSDQAASNQLAYLEFLCLRNRNKFVSFPKAADILKLLTADRRYMFLAIPVFGRLNKNDMSDQIFQMRNEYRKDTERERLCFQECCFRKPTENADPDELDKYLITIIKRNENIQDHAMTKTKAAETIIADERMTNNKTNDDRGTPYNTIQARLKRIDNIFNNIKKGLFPGDYVPKKNKR